VRWCAPTTPGSTHRVEPTVRERTPPCPPSTPPSGAHRPGADATVPAVHSTEWSTPSGSGRHRAEWGRASTRCVFSLTAAQGKEKRAASIASTRAHCAAPSTRCALPRAGRTDAHPPTEWSAPDGPGRTTAPHRWAPLLRAHRTGSVRSTAPVRIGVATGARSWTVDSTRWAPPSGAHSGAPGTMDATVVRAPLRCATAPGAPHGPAMSGTRARRCAAPDVPHRPVRPPSPAPSIGCGRARIDPLVRLCYRDVSP
jgi:hypothetical protein